MRYRRLQTLGFVALLATLTVVHCLPTEVQADRRRSTTFLAATDETSWSEWDGVTANPELTDAHPTTGWPRDYGRLCVTFIAGPSGEPRVIIDGRTGPEDPRPYLDVVNDGRIRFGIQTVGSIAGGAIVPGKVHTVCVERSYGPNTSLYLDGQLIGTSSTLPAWDWYPTARLGSRYGDVDPLVGKIDAIQWRGLRFACDLRSATCSDGRQITTTRSTPVPCEVSPGVWEMVPENTACISWRGLEAWNANTSYLSWGAELDRSPWQAEDGVVVQSLPRGGYRVSGVGEGSNVFQLVTPGSGPWTFACVADTGASIGASLRVYPTGGTGTQICNLDSVPGFKTHSCTTNITGTPTALSVHIYPGSGHVDVAGCWLTRTEIAGRPCWGGAANVTCAADRHTISTEGWPPKNWEVSLVYTPLGDTDSADMYMFLTTGIGLDRTYATGVMEFSLLIGSTVYYQRSSALVWENGRAYHIILRWSPERSEMWRDGVRLRSWVPAAMPASLSSTAYIGTPSAADGRRAQGAIRDLRIRSYYPVPP